MATITRNDQIPEEFLSSIIKAKGFASFNEILQISPSNTFNQFMTNEVIKFQFKTPDYIDPYDIYFDVQIESVMPTNGTLKSHRLYLDGSSSSLFQEIQIYSRSRHIETIRQHDEVMQVVNSIGFDPDNAPAQAYLGYNINNPGGGTARQPSNFKCYQTNNMNNINGIASLSEQSLFPIGYLPQKGLPRMSQSLSTTSPWISGANQSLVQQDISATGSSSFMVGSSGNVSRTTSPCLPFDTANINCQNRINAYFTLATQRDAALYNFGGVRCELNETLDGSLGVQGANRGIVYDPSVITQYHSEGDLDVQAADTSHGWWQRTHQLGYQSFWSAATSEGNKCQWLDYGYGQTWLANGAIQDKPIASNTMRVQVPLNSGIFGTLLPDHKLVPGESLGDTEIQVRLNPYAFFASGLSRDADNADSGKGQIDLTNYQLPRQWRIKDIQLVIHTYSFDQAFTSQLRQQLQNGIVLRSNGFDFAQSTSVQDTRFLQGSWPIITGIQSLKALYVYFLSDEYQSKTFCRKHYRLSGNVTSIQLKLNADYYPRRPVQGHAGNPVINTLSPFDNSEFVVWYQKQLGFFNTQMYTTLNRVNFAINTRSYDTSLAATTVYSGSRQKYKDYLLLGLPGQEEQRYVGKALYPFAFVQKPQKSNVLQGIDVSNLKPFEILIKVDQINYNPLPCTIMILQHFNIEVNFTPNGVNVFGYA